MEQSKQFKYVIDLGKRLVKELGLSKSTDTLGRWMAHHIAELIEQTDNADGNDRSKLEDRCREAILELWKHIEVFPKSARPLEDLQSILATIRALDPEEQVYFYQQQAQEAVDNSKLSEDAKKWLELSRGLDYSARLLILMCLKNAVDIAGQQCSDWIELSEKIQDQELPVLNIIGILNDKTDSDREREATEAEIKRLEDRRDGLRGMIQLSDLLADDLDAKITSLKSVD